MKLTKRHKNVLDFLSHLEGWCSGSRLPDGNGRHCGASASTLDQLRRAELIIYGKEPAQSGYGYQITLKGRAALKGENP